MVNSEYGGRNYLYANNISFFNFGTFEVYPEGFRGFYSGIPIAIGTQSLTGVTLPVRSGGASARRRFSAIEILLSKN
jgi:hypothetical protein